MIIDLKLNNRDIEKSGELFEISKNTSEVKLLVKKIRIQEVQQNISYIVVQGIDNKFVTASKELYDIYKLK